MQRKTYPHPLYNESTHQVIAQCLGVELHPYHISSDFLAAVGTQYELEDNLIGDKANTVIFDCSKLRRAVPGFVAATRFDQGARLAVEHILQHPELQQADPEFDAWCDRVIAAVDAAKASVC